MTDKKNVVTEVQALTAVLEFAPTAEVREKLEHMIEVRSRKRERKTDDSKRLANMDLGAKFVEVWKDETFKASDVADALDISTQKANAVIRAMGWVTTPTTEKVNVYRFF